MAISLRPVSVIGSNGNRVQKLFAQLVFSGNYSTGGDTVTVDETDAPSYTQGLREAPMLPVDQPPVIFVFQPSGQAMEYGFNLVAGTQATDFKIKVFIASEAGGAITSAELGAGAYPADLKAATDIFVLLEYQSLL